MGPAEQERVCFTSSPKNEPQPHCQNWPNLSSWGQGGDRVEAERLASNHLPQDLTLEGFQRPLSCPSCEYAQGLRAVGC